MSNMNGDKARFNKKRKQKIARRLRQREMFGASSKEADPTVRGSRARSREKSA